MTRRTCEIAIAVALLEIGAAGRALAQGGETLQRHRQEWSIGSAAGSIVDGFAPTREADWCTLPLRALHCKELVD